MHVAIVFPHLVNPRKTVDTLATTMRSRAIETLRADLMGSHMSRKIAGSRDAGAASGMRTMDTI